ncbi:uncharacterized protein LOC103509464 [Diaphorina citri]|uniref:Uncharacterized protein LOC103509464 n=1 Tax=Diaphorina citri TaxID=121845 RepID=A0A1S3D1I8_DIACI|nr:uncharacterized protein LOC103509464 [Diaphorina citri]XP_008472309.1 uncharacterized protein LOC103509464 [Diaphorina citri]
MSSLLTKPHLKVFQELLHVVKYPGSEAYVDESAMNKLFRNIDETYKQDLFVWIIKEFDPELEPYGKSEEKLRWLLCCTGMIPSEIECTNFLSGLLPNEEQMKHWKNILLVVYSHNKKEEPEIAARKELSNKSESAQSKLKCINLLPPEYQKDFEEQTKGDYKDYIKRMKEKLSRDQEGKENAIQSNSRGVSEGASLEDTIAKVVNFKGQSHSASQAQQLDLEAVTEFCSNYEKLVKPHIGHVLDQSSDKNIPHLDHLAEFLEEYSFMAQVIDTFKHFEKYRGLVV